MRVLITGANGFVGTYLKKHLEACGDQVLATGLLNSASKLDITNLQNADYVISSYAPDVIYHLAGIAFVPEAEKDFSRTLKVNVEGTYNVIKAAVNAKVKKFVMISSAEVYGLTAKKQVPLTETSGLAPANNYSLSKLLAEQVCLKFFNSEQIDLVIFRPFNHIGPLQNNNFVVPSFASQIKAAKNNEAIKVGNLKSKRDFSDVRDIVKAYRIGAIKGSGIYNLGSGEAVAVSEIFNKLVACSGKNIISEVDPARFRANEVPEIFGDISKARKELDWHPEISLDRSLSDIYSAL